MQTEPIIEFRHIERTPALLSHVELNLDKLTQFSPHIISCHIVVEHSQNSQHQGKMYNAKIMLALPGKELVVNQHDEENLYVAIQDSFSIMEAQLKSHMNKSHQETKTHIAIYHGTVARIIPDGYGFIEDVSGEEFYFSQNNVTNTSFNKLSIGDSVEFQEFIGDEGPQAHHVRRTDYYNRDIPEQAA